MVEAGAAVASAAHAQDRQAKMERMAAAQEADNNATPLPQAQAQSFFAVSPLVDLVIGDDVNPVVRLCVGLVLIFCMVASFVVANFCAGLAVRTVLGFWQRSQKTE